VKSTLRAVAAVCLAFYLASPAMASEEVTAERLGEFYPAQWETEAVGKPAFSHLKIPGHQKASTSRYYAFGQVEFIYYDKPDSVYNKRVDKMKARDKKFEDVEISGCPAVVFTKKRAIADIGGEILAYLECYTCESSEDLMARFQKIDLGGLKGLLK
jgi:hypothetical protein